MQKLVSWPIAAAFAVGLPVAATKIPMAYADRPKTGPQPIYFELYQPQKVIYHVTGSGGLFDKEYLHLLTVANNHMNAVGEGFLDLRVVMQGDGLDLLIEAKKVPKIAAAIDRLKKQGARFVICWNTLVARNLDPQRDLYGVAKEDIVSAGIAEVAMLQAQGYVYLKP